ncbi:MAG: hypothetical protein DWI12_05805 [Planctomycetota bacterium]|nr:MAG: hypothetical protein DWI12_05805 [Planctomycetota bacterium]
MRQKSPRYATRCLVIGRSYAVVANSVARGRLIDSIPRALVASSRRSIASMHASLRMADGAPAVGR